MMNPRDELEARTAITALREIMEQPETAGSTALRIIAGNALTEIGYQRQQVPCALPLITREEFEEELRKIEDVAPAVRLLREALERGHKNCAFDQWPPHLKKEAYQRIGVEPVLMYRRTR